MKKLGCIVIVACALFLGCNQGDPHAFRLQGKVSRGGMPIPYGDIVFTPDGSLKNFGPQGFANIREGRYDTADAEGAGFSGGPVVIRVTGFEKEGGKLICEYEYQAELPRENGTFDIELPADAEVNVNQPTPDI